MSNANEILPGIWLGNIFASQDQVFIEEKNIKCIINCTVEHPFAVSVPVRYRISIRDNMKRLEFIKLYAYLDEALSIIKRAIDKKLNILVHCYAGKQRSPAVIVAFMCKYGDMTLDQAIKAIKSKRPTAFRPYFNFLEPIKEYLA